MNRHLDSGLACFVVMVRRMRLSIRVILPLMLDRDGCECRIDCRIRRRSSKATEGAKTTKCEKLHHQSSRWRRNAVDAIGGDENDLLDYSIYEA